MVVTTRMDSTQLDFAKLNARGKPSTSHQIPFIVGPERSGGVVILVIDRPRADGAPHPYLPGRA
jgi:hypothetical protein